jgi:hypothetical protein
VVQRLVQGNISFTQGDDLQAITLNAGCAQAARPLSGGQQHHRLARPLGSDYADVCAALGLPVRSNGYRWCRPVT